MSSLTRPPDSRTSPELVLEWPSLNQPAVRGRTLAISLLLHAVGLAVLVLLAGSGAAPVESSGRGFRSSTVLVAPPIEFTQTAPNRAKIGKEFSLDNLTPRPALRAPRAIPAPAPPGAPVAPPEPPRVPLAGPTPQATPALQLGSTQMPGPPPQLQTEEKPRLPFMTPGVPSGAPQASGQDLGQLKSPGEMVAEASRASPHSSGGAVQVSDADLLAVPGLGGGFQQAPAPGRRATALELMSDPGGVDFKPYLIRILATVKRNWQAVIPETARLGRQGRVQIQFAIDRSGSVPKLVIAVPSGTESLDRAAVAGISASAPFPPLPPDFQGSQVRLQFTFTYNMR
jgi:TonB family protein